MKYTSIKITAAIVFGVSLTICQESAAQRLNMKEKVNPQTAIIVQEKAPTQYVVNEYTKGDVFFQEIDEARGHRGDVIIFDTVDEMPSFPGGTGALGRYLSQNIKYPSVAENNGIQGNVICSFVVEKDGSITDTHIVKSVNPFLDMEALRVIRTMPHWIPGKHKGINVRVRFTLPIKFRLQ